MRCGAIEIWSVAIAASSSSTTDRHTARSRHISRGQVVHPRRPIGSGSVTVPAASGRITHAKAAEILAARDPVIARLVAAAGPPRLRRPQPSHYATLVQAIVYQQLAGATAATIHRRVITALDGDVRPEAVLALSVETLRGAGLSAAKVASLQD